MNPLPDRVVVAGVVLTIALCFALAFWTARRHPADPPLQWRNDAPPLTRDASLL
ncbi:MAG: hypothetical protein VKI81_01640 [Synechococcaceae cyanobacterium]|nr:hypothetical protein [Synechococcaceae cyanobacterium]